MATASQITVSGNKKIATLQKEFSAKFPYLGIVFYSEEEWTKTQRSEIGQTLRADQTIASVRTKVHPEPLSIHGRTKVATLEKNFLEQYGMYCQVIFRKKGETRPFYTSGDQDQYSLTDFNRKLEASGEYLQMT